MIHSALCEYKSVQGNYYYTDYPVLPPPMFMTGGPHFRRPPSPARCGNTSLALGDGFFFFYYVGVIGYTIVFRLHHCGQCNEKLYAGCLVDWCFAS